MHSAPWRRNITSQLLQGAGDVLLSLCLRKNPQILHSTPAGWKQSCWADKLLMDGALPNPTLQGRLLHQAPPLSRDCLQQKQEREKKDFFPPCHSQQTPSQLSCIILATVIWLVGWQKPVGQLGLQHFRGLKWRSVISFFFPPGLWKGKGAFQIQPDGQLREGWLAAVSCQGIFSHLYPTFPKAYSCFIELCTKGSLLSHPSKLCWCS